MKIVFDIGGTSMRVAVATEDGIGEIRKIPTSQDPGEGVRQLAELAKQSTGEGIEKAAGGFPGVVQEGIVREAPNLPQWVGFAIGEELSAALGGSVSIQNDGDMAALGEATFGAGQGKRVVAYIGVGTGVGGGRIVEGSIDSGAYNLEPGHQIIDTKELRDLESFVSGRAFEKRFNMHPKDAPKSAYDEMTPLLAVGIYNVILLWSPDIFVLGGSMVVGVNGYRVEEIEAALEKISGKPAMIPEIVAAKLKDAAGLHGARALLS